MAFTSRLFHRLEVLRGLNPDQGTRASEHSKKPRNMSLPPAPAYLYSLKMNAAQKQFSLTGVSLKKRFPIIAAKEAVAAPRLKPSARVKVRNEPLDEKKSNNQNELTPLRVLQAHAAGVRFIHWTREVLACNSSTQE